MCEPNEEPRLYDNGEINLINVLITYNEPMFNGDTDIITKTVNQRHKIIRMR